VGLAILDVAIGLILVYLVLSLVASAVTEMISQKRGKRGEFLKEGIRSLFGRALSDDFYRHKRIRNLSHGDALPSYIPSEAFADAVLDMALAYVPKAGAAPPAGRERIAAFARDQDAVKKQGGAGAHEAKIQAALGRTLLSFWDEARGDRALVSQRIQRWFDDSMDRVSGWYRRWSQRVLLRVGVVTVLLLNADTIRIVDVLYTTPVVREALVAEAQRRDESRDSRSASAIRRDVSSVAPVLGWRVRDLPSFRRPLDWLGFVLGSALGFAITILAVSMGANFWFNALKQLLRVRARVSTEEPKEARPPGASAAPAPPPSAGATLPGFRESFEADAARHSHANAYWLGRAAELAYQDEAGFRGAVAGWGVQCRYVGVGDTQAHVAAGPDRMIVAFRGTETNPGDIATDAKFKLVDWSGPGKVHGGFLKAFDGAPWKAVTDAMAALAQPGQTLWFAGHSLGGALAVLAALRWTLEGRKPAVAGVYTIGQPRVGDKAFTAALEGALGARLFRYVNNRDIVPRVPLRAMGYEHAGTILYFDGTGLLHTDPALWFQLLDTAFVELSQAKASLKETVGDHSAVEYVERLRRAFRG
jgi:hypothetical protein